MNKPMYYKLALTPRIRTSLGEIVWMQRISYEKDFVEAVITGDYDDLRPGEFPVLLERIKGKFCIARLVPRKELDTRIALGEKIMPS